MTKKQFYDKYWFTPFDMVKIRNIKSEDFRFMVEMRHFIIRANSELNVPGTVANVYLNQMTKILAQDEEKMHLLSDYNFRAEFYDRLIVETSNNMPVMDSTPEYLKRVPQEAKVSEVKPMQPNQGNETVEQSKNEESTKEFTYENMTYKMITDKNGEKMYFRDGRRTSEAEYSKAASMI